MGFSSKTVEASSCAVIVCRLLVTWRRDLHALAYKLTHGLTEMKINYAWEKMNKSASRTAEAFGESRGVQKV